MKKILLSLILLFILTGHSWAVVSSTISQNEYACNSSNTAWNYTFPIILSTDIQVWTIDQYGNPTQQTSNFSVNTYTQTVTYPVTGTPCATGNNLLLLRVQPFTQLVAASNQGPAPSPVVMGMSDKLTMLAQQLQAQINRAVLAPIGSTSGAGYALPSPLANAAIGWDPTATFLVNQTSQALLPTSSPTFAGLNITGLGGMVKAGAGGALGTGTIGVDYSGPSNSETLTNKTFDTASNTFKLNGTTFSGGLTGNGTNIITGTSIKGSSGVIASASGSPTANNCAKWDASGNLVDNGSTCSGGSGMTYPASSGFAVSDTTKWLTSVSTTGGIASANINWPDLNANGMLKSGGVNWSDINGYKTITTGINWQALPNIVQSANVNWNDINKNSNINAGGINWQDLSHNQLLPTGINWQSTPGLLKTSGNVLSSAVSGTDYAPATSGTALLYGNNLGGFSSATVGAGLSFSGGSLTATQQGFVPNNIQVFTTSGTWTKPSNVSTVYVKVIGGGGTGGTSAARNGGNSNYGGPGGGGGGGGYSEGIIAVTGNVTVTIGSTNSFAGTTTIQATTGSTGGTGASNAASAQGGSGGAGGTGSGGTINLSGSTGGAGGTAVGTITPGNGGMGGGGWEGSSVGRGADGVTSTTSTSPQTGSAGDPGAVIVYY